MAKGSQKYKKAKPSLTGSFYKVLTPGDTGLSSKYAEIADRLGKQEEEVTRQREDVNRQSKEIEQHKGIIIFGFIVLLVMVAQMLVDVWALKVNTYGNLVNQVNLQNTQLEKLNLKVDNISSQLIESSNENQQQVVEPVSGS